MRAKPPKLNAKKPRIQRTRNYVLRHQGAAIDLLPFPGLGAESVTLEDESFKPHIQELVHALRRGASARPAASLGDNYHLEIDGRATAFWISLHFSDAGLTKLNRVHVLSCAPRNSDVEWIGIG